MMCGVLVGFSSVRFVVRLGGVFSEAFAKHAKRRPRTAGNVRSIGCWMAGILAATLASAAAPLAYRRKLSLRGWRPVSLVGEQRRTQKLQAGAKRDEHREHGGLK